MVGQTLQLFAQKLAKLTQRQVFARIGGLRSRGHVFVSQPLHRFALQVVGGSIGHTMQPTGYCLSAADRTRLV
jgi:hypothetical protein